MMNTDLYNALTALNGTIVDAHGHQAKFFQKWGNILSPLPKGFKSDEAHSDALELLQDMQTSLLAFTAMYEKAVEVAEMTVSSNEQ